MNRNTGMSQEDNKNPEAAEDSRKEIGNKTGNADVDTGEKVYEETASDATNTEEISITEEATPEEAEEKSETESERYLRLAAEFDNYKKRTAREFGEITKTANFRLLRSLIEIVDNFERALSHDLGNNDGEAYRKGIELIYSQLTDLLKKENVTPIESVGQKFDPHYHEAMMQTESEDYDEGLVCDEIQKGYRIKDKVLRHARVVVSKGQPEDKDDK